MCELFVKHIHVARILTFSVYVDDALWEVFSYGESVTLLICFGLFKYLDVASYIWFIYSGNDYIHAMTSQAKYTLRVDLTAFNGSTAYAEYTTFAVAAESAKYRLSVGGYHGTAGEYEV